MYTGTQYLYFVLCIYSRPLLFSWSRSRLSVESAYRYIGTQYYVHMYICTQYNVQLFTSMERRSMVLCTSTKYEAHNTQCVSTRVVHTSTQYLVRGMYMYLVPCTSYEVPRTSCTRKKSLGHSVESGTRVPIWRNYSIGFLVLVHMYIVHSTYVHMYIVLSSLHGTQYICVLCTYVHGTKH